MRLRHAHTRPSQPLRSVCDGHPNQSKGDRRSHRHPEYENASLEINARLHRFDPMLDAAADLFHTDREAWRRLPRQVQSESSVYADLREHHRRAVRAGVIPNRED